jgi:formate-dependent nitrite reductase membrane component NrfD
MTETGVTGVNPIDYPELTTWEWPVAAYLFLGGLVGGLMVLIAVLRLRKDPLFTRAIRTADLWAIPLLSLGLLLLFVDLSYKVHAWRFFTTFQVTSAMSWGSWILLVTMIVLALRASFQLPATVWFESGHAPGWLRSGLSGLARLLGRHLTALDIVTIVLGTALALYTGILLSTIPAHPLWDSALLAPLFLVSGIAAGGAFLCLFLSPQAHRRLTPTAMGLCAAELALIGGFFASLALGTPATRRSAEILLSWPFGAFFWFVVVASGLLLPLTIESAEMRQVSVPGALSRSAPLLKLIGSAGLRFVIVVAGLQTLM